MYNVTNKYVRWMISLSPKNKNKGWAPDTIFKNNVDTEYPLAVLCLVQMVLL